MIRCLIIEDEPLAGKFLETLLLKTGRVEIVGIARDGDWGVTICSEQCPQAVFLDIGLPGRDGMQIAAELALLASPPCVIFTTSHADRACDAFRLRAVDFLVKPLRYSQILDAVSRIEEQIGSKLGKQALAKPGNTCVDPEDRLPVKCQEDGIVKLVPRAEIQAVAHRSRRTWILTESSQYPTYYAVAELESWLEGPPFVRISRESIVNLQAIAEVIRLGDRLFQVQLRDHKGTVLEASRSGSKNLTALIRPTK